MYMTKYRSASKTWPWLKKTRSSHSLLLFEGSMYMCVYRRVWVPHVGQHLSGEREDGNMEDRFAVAFVQHRLKNNEDSDARTMAGHLPRELSQILWYFLLHGGEIDCEVTGRKQRSPLIQGGLEIPCCVTHRGKKKLVAKAKEVLEKKTKLYNRK